MVLSAQGGLPNTNRKKTTRRRKKLKLKPAPLIVLLILGFVLYSFAGQMGKVYKVHNDVKTIETELQSLKEKNNELKAEINRLEQEDYVEKVAREELGMVKKGEKVILPVTPGQITTP